MDEYISAEERLSNARQYLDMLLKYKREGFDVPDSSIEIAEELLTKAQDSYNKGELKAINKQ